MAIMNVKEFIAKWKDVSLKEISASQSHFNDICALVGHKTPVEADPTGIFFTFEEPAKKTSGKTGRADAWFKGKFIWEYKGVHANLDEAYNQLLLYRDSLGNPPLLITSDMHKIVIHTNFTNTIKETYEVDFDNLDGVGVELLRRVFEEPESFKPSKTQEQVTKATAESFLAITTIIEKWSEYENEEYIPEKTAHFIGRLFFSLFAEDMGLLPLNVITNLAGNDDLTMSEFSKGLKTLFSVMSKGGIYGTNHIRYFDGTLFDDNFIPSLKSGDIKSKLYAAAKQDWTSIDPSIFGTLFERIIDKSKRSQLGLHYTDKKDIMLVIEPVVMKPLLEKWYSIKSELDKLVNEDREKAYKILVWFSNYLGQIKILDPACGSANFLYVALQQVLNLQKEVIVTSAKYGLGEIELSVSPDQLYGIEKDLYAHELAQITVWIGYIQWRFENGFGNFPDPVLKPLKNIVHKDAILEYSEDGKPKEVQWPTVDFIVGNPPFLGSRKMVPELGDKYCSDLRHVYKDKLSGYPDLVCYWFEKAADALKKGKVERVGLLATQAIRGGTNREVLDKIVDQGAIFMAWSDKDWILDGATVHVSIVGFDMGKEKNKYLNGSSVSNINSNLTATSFDITKAVPLEENSGLSFQGVVLRGKFNISKTEAEEMLHAENQSGLKNSDVIKPRRTGKDILQRAEDSYVIDFGSMKLEEVKKYEEPFEYIKSNVYPERQKTLQKEAREKWWIHWNIRTQMRAAISNRNRYIATPRVSKHRVFVWLDKNILPDAQLVVFARDDDYFFGVLHSKVHEIWARNKGTQLRDAESGFRYTSTTTFETFPFPWAPGTEPENDVKGKISELSYKLTNFRNLWLNPPAESVGLSVSRHTINRRTLTELYNSLFTYRSNYKNQDDNQRKWNREVDNIISLQDIAELDFIHNKLDDAVLNAYGLETSSSDDQILEHLLKLNLERSNNLPHN